ncbi:Chaperone protein DnaJ [Bdellovibrio bacteriovorus]|uniref:J domain-containing protein n=1 Tax=Bdellovibrio bacteriovorus TaxID=959 RepID=UPI00045BEB6A|nr:J domain-containing protein [Bdellovibrio bacteriovorus]AHZ86751.1 molecular chaperone DnaJ [Bdellovibrio bacteriovorus]BEV67191.1 Chaperone protein DnaJ [Bdellovibrio bacteriovorus]
MKNLILLVLLSLIMPVGTMAQTADEVRRIMNSQSSHYDILNVSKNASADEIRTAYRRLMKTYHPDRYQNDPQKLRAATEVMKKLNVSRDILMDPMARQRYDATVKSAPKTTAKPTTAAQASAKPESVNPKPEPKKWSGPDFEAEAKAKAEAAAKAKAEAAMKANAKTSEPPKQETKSSAKEAPKSATESGVSSARAESSKPATVETAKDATVRTEQPMNHRTQQAVKFYEDTAKCGAGFYKSFVDMML